MRQRDVPVSRLRIVGRDADRLLVRRLPDYKIGALALMSLALAVHLLVWFNNSSETTTPSTVLTFAGWLLLGGGTLALMRAGVSIDVRRIERDLTLRRGVFLRRPERYSFNDISFRLTRSLYYNEADAKSGVGIDTLDWQLVIPNQDGKETLVRLDSGADIETIRTLAQAVSEFSGAALDDRSVLLVQQPLTDATT
ncbi:MAG: hypothetical protein ABIH86_01980 [Planctomycetota bacterium]